MQKLFAVRSTYLHLEIGIETLERRRASRALLTRKDPLFDVMGPAGWTPDTGHLARYSAKR